MKIINPPQRIWINGQEIEGTVFNLVCTYDNLKDEAVFFYALFTNSLIKLVDGNLKMNDQEYINDWSTNDAAYDWAAKKLGLTITGNYVLSN